MDISSMNIEELETRLSAIKTELDGECDIEALTEEVNQIEARKKEIADKAKEAEELRNAIANGEVDITDVKPVYKEERTMKDIMEVRKSAEYVDAFVNYIKTEKDEECRALLTENATNGTVPVPAIVEEIVTHAWETNEIMNLVKKTNLKGNVKGGFEISATDAVIHTEGAAAITPETLTLGIYNIEPQSLKKTIQISDEAYDLTGEAFLRYIYEELSYRIAKLASDTLIGEIAAADGTGTTSVPAQAVIAEAPSLTTVANAIANLSDEAVNPVIVMNKATYATFKGIQANANYAQDVFEGLPVYYSSALPAFSAADEEDVYMIVGDFGRGALANFPNGSEIKFKFDDTTYMRSDLVEILGRMFVGLGLVAPKCFVNIAVPEAEDAGNGGEDV